MEKDEYPISEVFGPTLQGEGPLAGFRTLFIRFAGCDFDCGASGGPFVCDTRYAVNPKYPGWKREMMTSEQIVRELSLTNEGTTKAMWITLSGGNPALFFDDRLGSDLVGEGYRLAMETQGSVAIPISAMSRLSVLVVSPKPPSSGMATRLNFDRFTGIVDRAKDCWTRVALKFVVFDDDDLNWVHETRSKISSRTIDRVDLYLSVGSPVNTDLSLHSLRDGILDRYRWLWEKVATDPRFSDYIALPQLHTLVFGQVKGV